MLRDRDGENLREHLISTAARLIDERGSAGLAVRDIAREAQVSDGALYNYFEDKEDLLAQALLAHVGQVMNDAPQMIPGAGTATVVENLTLFIDRGMESLYRVVPAFAGLMSQPNVLRRFHDMVGGDQAFAAPAGEQDQAGEGGGPEGPAAAAEADHEPRSLPEILLHYLRAEQGLGRIDPEADLDAATSLIVGAIHGQVLPRVLFAPPGARPATPPGLAAQLATTALRGLAPRKRRRPT
ncbi:MAG TPA: helix-turn-helix domain-containing protein [Streptosporangiaceae bacterium]